jgi:hypothetical protein
MRGAQFDSIVVQSRANGGKAVPNLRRRSDRGVLDDSVRCCGRACGSMSALGGIRSSRRRMNLRNTLFGSQSKSTSRSPRIQRQRACRTEPCRLFRCIRIRSLDLAVRVLHNPVTRRDSCPLSGLFFSD